MPNDLTDNAWSDRELHLLVVEDSTDDADLLILELQRAGFRITRHARVETAEEMHSVLDQKEWDLVISDHQMPSFSAFQALEIIQKRTIDTPFIIVSGAIGEDSAVQAMRSGAHDYILKGNLARLIPAIQRELGEAEQRRRRRAAEQASIRFNERLSILHDIDRAIIAAQSLEEIASSVLGRLGLLLGSSEAFLLLTDTMVATRTKLLAYREWGESSEGTEKQIGMEVDIAPLFSPLQNGVSIWTAAPDFLIEPGIVRATFKPLSLRGLEGQIIVSPVKYEDRLLALLVNIDGEADIFTEEQVEVAGDVANQLSVAFQQAILVDQIERHAEELEERVEERTRELKEANEELEAFTYSVSHDLRAPLRSVQDILGTLLQEQEEQLDESILRQLRQIDDGTRRMENLIRDLLTYSQLRHQTIRLWPVSLSGTIEAILEWLGPQIADAGGEVTIVEPLPRITGDQEIVGIIIDAILRNCLIFRSDARPLEVTISAETGAGSTRLLISDNGIGINPEFRERAFRIFERSDRVEEREGNGIGLALVRKGIERMGGTCGIESDGSSGTTLWLEWPQKPISYS